MAADPPAGAVPSAECASGLDLIIECERPLGAEQRLRVAPGKMQNIEVIEGGAAASACE